MANLCEHVDGKTGVAALLANSYFVFISTAYKLSPEHRAILKALLSGTVLVPARDATPVQATDTPILDDVAAASHYAEASRALSTQRAYAADWRRFAAWSLGRGVATLPADPRALAVFLAAEVAGWRQSAGSTAAPGCSRRRPAKVRPPSSR